MFSSPNFIRRVPAFLLVPLRVSSMYKAHEKSKFMQKLINKKGAKAKKQWYKPHLGEPSEVEPRKGISHGHSVRLRQLSHVLYDRIVEIINSGELSQDILEKQVSITSVNMAKDMNNLNIYWDSDRDDWEQVEQLLQALGGKLRSLLISYHVLGRIPHVVFVKDKTIVNLSELTELFEKADYGPDYVPGSIQTDVMSLEDELGSQKVRQGGMSSDDARVQEYDARLQSEERDNDNNDCLHDNLFENGLDLKKEQSPMQKELLDDRGNLSADSASSNSEINSKDLNYRSDLYGLNRDEIMKKIFAKRKKPIVSAKTEPLLPLDFDIKSDIAPALQSPTITKTKLKRILAKEERRLKEKMLVRDDFDF